MRIHHDYRVLAENLVLWRQVDFVCSGNQAPHREQSRSSPLGRLKSGVSIKRTSGSRHHCAQSISDPERKKARCLGGAASRGAYAAFESLTSFAGASRCLLIGSQCAGLLFPSRFARTEVAAHSLGAGRSDCPQL